MKTKLIPVLYIINKSRTGLYNLDGIMLYKYSVPNGTIIKNELIQIFFVFVPERQNIYRKKITTHKQSPVWYDIEIHFQLKNILDRM
ncbi:MAG: hypothetical protein D8M26_08080 [Ignavibacteriae bacterium]|nr:hypothetical protein [Ignavibacteriota bacterium]MCE7857371.1 hypothetical protein [Ignavibacteria bacterium CHB3]